MRGLSIFVRGAALVFALALTACTVQAQDQPLTERERMLLERVEALEKRIEDLEKNQAARQAVKAVQQEQSQAQLEGRVTEIETKLDEEEESSATDLRAFWKDGLRFETKDGAFKLRIGGRIQNDWAWFDQDEELKLAVADEQDGTEFRRARIRLDGQIYDNLFYRAQFDFAGSDGQGKFKDVYMGLKNIPYVGTLKIGHFKEPFGLEQLTSDNYLTFLEYGLPDVFTPARNLGVSVSNSAFDKRLAWAAGLFKQTDDFPSFNDSDEDQGYVVTARLTGLPWYADEGRKLLHLGLAYSHRNPDGAPVRYRQRPESHLANRYLDTNGAAGYRLIDARADDIDLWGLEWALVLGPFSLQSEYMTSMVETTFGGDFDFDGYYVYGSYFLTGENRRYKLDSGKFDRIKPTRNFSFGEDGGWGAWEVAVRYSTLDLNDGIIRGGQEDNWTLGLNWYLTPNSRMMLNYVMADIEHDLYEGDLNIFQTRFQIDF
jgi:phosphate-selective porin OprO/OprP